MTKHDQSIPLCVDLDGTLVLTDTLHESFLQLIKRQPLTALKTFLTHFRDRAAFKHHVSLHTTLDVTRLPYNQPLLSWLKQQKAAGRPLHLVTAAHHTIAQAVAGHLGLFDSVIASDQAHNRKGRFKADALIRQFGDRQFDYAGNDHHDLAIWPHARNAILVGASSATTAAARLLTTPINQEFPRTKPTLATWLYQLRTYQWVKNLLLFVPILTAHQLANSQLLTATVIAFISFSFMASAIYILNDLLDIDADRSHPHKQHRPIASGRVTILQGLIALMIIVSASLALSYLLPRAFTALLIVYALANLLYSFRLKKLPIIDVIALTTMYVLRIIAGAAATAIPISHWLFLFAGLIFISFGLVKRVNELNQDSQAQKSTGRGYTPRDAPRLTRSGIAAGLLAILVLSFYLQADSTRALYRQPHLLWILIPLFLFWLLRIWRLATQGKIHHDPIITATTDPISYLTAIGTLITIFIAT